jgi:pimeloyl-ACP methyl ester carboxylesterase
MSASSRRLAVLDAMPEGWVADVRSADGIRIHTEVFGPEDGYPIVLAHGITCAIEVWVNQIVDLAREYRVIAYDHRGHGEVACRRAGAAPAITAWTSSPPTSMPYWTRRWRTASVPAVGRDADPAIADFVFDLFARTPPAGRGGWARALVDSLKARHISLRNLTVPTLVIGSRADRLLPIVSSRRIAGGRRIWCPSSRCPVGTAPFSNNPTR